MREILNSGQSHCFSDSRKSEDGEGVGVELEESCSLKFHVLDSDLSHRWRGNCDLSQCVSFVHLGWTIHMHGEGERESKRKANKIRRCSKPMGVRWFISQIVKSEISQLCPTLCDSMDCSLPRSSVQGIFQARVLEWVAISYSRGSSWPRDLPLSLCLLHWQADSLPLCHPESPIHI